MANNVSLEDESLLSSDTTFTLERVRSQLRRDRFRHDPDSSERSIPRPFVCDGHEYSLKDGRHYWYTGEEQLAQRKSLCYNLLKATNDHEDHCLRLDEILSGIVLCNFQPKEDIEDISCHAFETLARLPARPLPLPQIPTAFYSEYLDADPPRKLQLVESDSLWPRLKVTSYVSTNVIRTALLFQIYPASANSLLSKFLDNIADILTTATAISSIEESQVIQQNWFVVRAFLWTCWQRCSMVYFHGLLGKQLRLGYDDQISWDFTLKGMELCPSLSIQEMSKTQASLRKPRYMCGWAFELLRSDPVCIGLDFRRFFSRYRMVFGGEPGRCIKNHPEASCLGDEPDRCQRFKGMKIDNQSAHEISCDGGCERLFWDDASYRSTTGARAVGLESSESRKGLFYRQASSSTLAISHVWSHGQGGRPERGPLETGHGLNTCLHQRYVSIARSLGCDSYWMDTPCIPENHKLRKEAIERINEVFENSKVTLVCDKDLMAIDASNLTIEVSELILTTILVCDWNLRAWTFLEAFRGRSNVRVLCKNNVVLSLKEVVEIVYREGAIDIGLLLLSAPHLLPSRITRAIRNRPSKSYIDGFLTVETGGSLLSHRAASRKGDDIVIWSLLLDDKVYNDAEAFWRSREGTTLPTSFLVSSAPRLHKKKGLTWAPSSPIAQSTRQRLQYPATRYLAYDGSESDNGSVQSAGFLANWLAYDFTGPCIGSKLLSSIANINIAPEQRWYRNNMRTIRSRYLRGYCWGALLRPINRRGNFLPAINRDDVRRILLVVCASNHRLTVRCDTDVSIPWKWRGVYEWDMAEPLPKFTLWQHVLIV